jgi:hypothetical protein
MQIDPPARHSLLGPFQRVRYLVHGAARTHRSNLGELANCRPLCAASHAATDRLATRVRVGVGTEGGQVRSLCRGGHPAQLALVPLGSVVEDLGVRGIGLLVTLSVRYSPKEGTCRRFPQDPSRSG